MKTAEDSYKIVVIGASAGGVRALQELVGQLHDQMKAAFFVVMHVGEKGLGSYLVYKLQQLSALPCVMAEEGMAIQQGHIYIAPPDKHLLVSSKGIALGLGPKENRWKPPIDVLFRSAAAAFNGRTIGMVLTGYLNDGAAGMLAIKKSGGICLVQDPNEAEYPDMPLAVLDALPVDYCVPLAQMGQVLEEAIGLEKEETRVPEEVALEAAIAERAASGIEQVEPLGNNSVYSCPDCGGVLFSIQEQAFTRYRCHTGHSYTQDDLLVKPRIMRLPSGLRCARWKSAKAC